MNSLIRWIGCVSLCALLLVGCREENTASETSAGSGQGVTLAGSTSVQPFAELLAEHYAAEHPDAPPINVQGGGSTAGVQAAATGTADIGMASRNLKPSEEELGLSIQMIARDAIAVIVHPSNSVRDLTLEQVRGIFAGEITSWAEVGGENREIHVVTREEGSGTRGAFEELVMEEEWITLRAIREDSNGAVRVIVANDPYAIGYISLGIVNDQVRAVRLDGVEASVENVRSGVYTLARPFLFLWKGELSPVAQAFLEYVLGEEGQALLEREGLIGVREE